ncbi:hypothetical protein [Sporosarcina beigongshangi]|uniref:hypothetical protein n=1 Tax=Sporosarcina beigongshangi TaxID=2782538 RepID=UPI00193A32CF|nr:hypothetical protein [Sporosarcina beigongshangi]
MKNTKLRIARIIPNVFCYLMFIGALIFVVSNAEGIKGIGQAPYWTLMLLALLGVSLLGSFRIWRWISDGKM